MTNRPDSQHLAKRKSDHLDLALSAQAHGLQSKFQLDYEPLFGRHPRPSNNFSAQKLSFLGKTMRLPLWVSSMTGGTEYAGHINRLLARACALYGMGMGLGSCRSLLESDEFFNDFNLRPELGPDVPFFANIGVAQLEELLAKGKESLLAEMVEALKADGLIVHLNPLQEWFQPEGDSYQTPSIEVLRLFKDKLSLPLVVKEVGQGMGPRSLLALCELGVEGIEFGAYGGTNFSKLENLRRDNLWPHWQDFESVGHSADEMLTNLLRIAKQRELPKLIISGGIRSCVQGYSLLSRAPEGSVLGIATPFLEQARKGADALDSFVKSWAEGLEMAAEFLAVQEENR